ncbi:hypothetical protein Peur_021585 [Populus x canadensis]
MHLRRSLNLRCTVKINTHSLAHVYHQWLIPSRCYYQKREGARDGLSTATTDSYPSCKLQDIMWSPVGSITVLFTVEIACLIAS